MDRRHCADIRSEGMRIYELLLVCYVIRSEGTHIYELLLVCYVKKPSQASSSLFFPPCGSLLSGAGQNFITDDAVL